MNYKAHYESLIARRQKDAPSGYKELHHVTPKALGGTDCTSNLVYLTAREHFVAHLLLAQIHGGAMWTAAAFMSHKDVTSARGYRCSSRIYAMLRENDAARKSIMYSGESNPFFGRKHDSNALSKMRRPRVNKDRLYGRKVPGIGAIISSVLSYKPRDVTVDTTIRDRIDEMFRRDRSTQAMVNYYRRSAGQRAVERDISGERNPNYGNGQAISGSRNPMWGKTHSDATKDKIAAKARRTLVCPHCGKESNIANAHRWHFDNCKNRSS